MRGLCARQSSWRSCAPVASFSVEALQGVGGNGVDDGDLAVAADSRHHVRSARSRRHRPAAHRSGDDGAGRSHRRSVRRRAAAGHRRHRRAVRDRPAADRSTATSATGRSARSSPMTRTSAAQAIGWGTARRRRRRRLVGALLRALGPDVPLRRRRRSATTFAPRRTSRPASATTTRSRSSSTASTTAPRATAATTGSSSTRPISRRPRRAARVVTWPAGTQEDVGRHRARLHARGRHPVERARRRRGGARTRGRLRPQARRQRQRQQQRATATSSCTT